MIHPPVRWPRASKSPAPIAFESYGVRVVVSADDPGLLRRIEPVLPENRRTCEADDPQLRYLLRSDGGAAYDVMSGELTACLSAELDVALAVLESQIRAGVAVTSTEGIFVHAGVVAHGDRAVLVPGASFSGKSTLVGSLVRRGAAYLSDEYAVLDSDGLVHPYPKPLSMRVDGTAERSLSRVESIGGVQGEEALPVGLIAVTSFRPGAVWRPKRWSAGQGALALLANTVPARVRPAESMRAVRAACEAALVLEGERGEADEAAPELLAALEDSTAARSPA